MALAVGVQAMAGDFRVDFNDAAANPAGNWNIIDAEVTGLALADYATGSTAEGVTLTLEAGVATWSFGTGTDGWNPGMTGPHWLDANRNAAVDYAYLSWNYNGRIHVDGLDPGQVYTVELVASRNTSQVDVLYDVGGDTRYFNVQDDGYLAGQWLTWVGASPDGTGRISVQCGVAGGHSYGTYINTVRVTASEAPDAIDDLAVGDVDWFKVELTWTAPSDNSGPNGGAAAYDIRYSTALITEANWDAATPCTGVPTPASPGVAESFEVTGLNADTLYYFAIKSSDEVALVSDLSNVASVTLPPVDSVPPAAVNDLAVVEIRPTRVTLEWTATGDDGTTGQASSYDVRYATSPIADEGDFAAATQATGEPTPSGPGTVEQFEVTGLSSLTTYYFAMKVGDEVPNFSAMSNVAGPIQTDQDVDPPDAITDLTKIDVQATSVQLQWTAPADTGTAGMGTYDVRYAGELITEANWNVAVQALGEPNAAAAGQTEQFTVMGLDPNTHYYFAVKSADLADPPNVSPLSNVIEVHTCLPVTPVVVVNPWIANDRVADCRTLATMAATFDNAYTPDGVVPPADDQERAINEYNNYKRRVYHWADQPPDMLDTVNVINLFGWVLCGRHAAHNCTILDAMGMGQRQIALPGHWIYEAYYDNAWHAFCTMTTMYTYNRANPPTVTSCAEYDADESLMLDAVAEGRACPGFLLCNDSPEWYASVMHSWYTIGSGVQPTDHTMDMTLRIGETLSRTWEAWPDQHTPSVTNADTVPGADPPYHHDAQHDWKDYVNWPYWEPYGLVDLNIAGTKATYRRWANGKLILEPDFRTAGYQACLEDSNNIATYHDDGLTPDLHLAATGSGYVVFKLDCPFYLTDAIIDGTFVRNDSGDANRIYFSTVGTGWSLVWENTATGTTELEGLSLRNYVYERFRDYWIKIEFDADGSINDAGVSDLVITTIFEHNKGALAYLDKGENNLSVTLDNPQDLVGTGVALIVRYRWKEYDGADWTIDQEWEELVTDSPHEFTIDVGGSKVPRTESITLEVASVEPDFVAPAAITDLAAGNPDSTTVDLSWTATGDDGMTGRAREYDIRYSQSPIDEGDWDAATAVADPPRPKDPGTAEQFTVEGLSSSTTYYFAIKVSDEAPNTSALSNVVSETTAPPDVTAPAAITDLAAATGTQSGTVELTWTAPGDDGMTGTAKTYDIRYSTSSINEGNWAGATQVDGEPAPQAGGSAEQFVVAGLTIGQTYYFAIKTSDEVPNQSGLSNVASAEAKLGEMTLQDGVNGYSGTRDNYMQSVTPDVNFGTYERLRVTGYADQGDIQRGLVRFDLSGIPTATPITSATLWLYSYDPAKCLGSTGFYGAYRLTTDWSETASTWNSPWTTAGGDFEATADGTAAKQPASAVPCWYSFNVTTRVQQWINNPSGNYGWVIKCLDEESHNQDEFYQSDTADAAHRPKLFITDLSPDTTPPAAITDLAAQTGAQSGSVDLTWTATGDDGATGTASSYDVRYSTSPIDSNNWAGATQVSGEPHPLLAGSPEQLTVTGLVTGQTLYFAVTALDEALNESDLSNVASAEAVLGTLVLQDGQDGYAGTIDNYVSLSAPDTNYGTFERMTVAGYGDLNDIQRGLVRFDLTGISPGSVISSAKLCLYSYDEAAVKGSSGSYGAHRVTTDWTENGSTWNTYDGTNPWTTAGGDFEATADANAPKQAVALVWYEFDVTSRVQGWIDNPANNLGWVVRCTDETSHNQDRFYQSDAADADHRPKLIVQDVQQYVVSTAASPLCTGEVTGGGAYGDGQPCTVEAIAYEHNSFVNWSGGPIDGSTNPIETFTVTGDVSVTANFQTDAGYISVCDYGSLKQAITTDAQPGDVIVVQPGVYQMNESRLSFYNAGEPGNPITIRGVMNGSQRPICEPAPGQEVDRAFLYIWSVDHDWVIENLEFRNSRGLDVLYSPNAAGMYVCGDNITIRNCYFHDNDMGLTGSTGATNILVENCEFNYNGTDLFYAYAHALYMSCDDLTVRGCYFHDAYGGMLFKSRCVHHVLEYSWLENDGSEQCVINAASANQDNALWRGNVFIKRSAPGGQRRIISLDDGTGLFGTVTMVNNTVISALTEDIYLASAGTNAADLVLRNNIFAGPSSDLIAWDGGGTITGNNNCFRTAMAPEVPAGVIDSVFSDDPGFVNLAGRDLRLLDTSACRNAGLNNPTYLNALDQWVDGTPQYEPTKTLSIDVRASDATLDIGAYEYYVPGQVTVAFGLTASNGAESVTPASLSVSLSEASAQTVTVDYAVTGGDATGGGVDYTLAAGTLTFDPNDVSETIDITIVDDGDVESDETIEVTLSNPSNATLGANTVHTYTINDNDAYPSVEFDLVSSSGDESVTPASLSVSLSTGYVQTVTVDYAVTGGDATGGGVDYTLAAGTLTFDPNDVAKTIDIAVVDDGLVEADETIEVTLSNPSNATLGANTVHTYTIQDNDAAPPAVDLRVDFNDAAADPAGNWNVVPAEVTDLALVDYVTGLSDHGITLTVNAASSSWKFRSGTDGWDAGVPGPSWLDASKDAAMDYAYLNWNLYGFIHLDGLNPGAEYTIELVASRDSSQQDVPYTVAGDTRYFNVQEDGYVGGQWLSWADVSPDGTGRITVQCAEPGGHNYNTYINALRVTTTQAASPTVQFDLTASAGAESVTPASLAVSLSAASAQTVTVDYAVTGGDATGGGVDYTLAAGTLTFDPNDVSETIDISIVDDGDVESDETIEVTLSSPSNATLGANTVHTYTINDNDVYPTVVFDLTASNGDESATPASLSVSLSAAYVQTVTVDYAVTGGDATGGGVDYTLAAGTLTFDPNDVAETIDITIVDDGLVESAETIEVTLSNPSNATLGANTVHTYTINDNDAYPTVAFDLTASAGDESVTPASLSVSLSAAYVQTVTVDYAVTGGDATGGGVDYTLAAGTLTFDPNDVTKTVDIAIVDDGLVEADETIEVTLSNPSNATLGANTVHTYTIQDDDAAPPAVDLRVDFNDAAADPAGNWNLVDAEVTDL
ncbi:MAG TPA: Calx-beta domain-containing protein, partial [Phycisphaerae bacterium]|nr:Calx-beta domain-containing protein [Phycisphaerae bacterium]